VVQNGAFPDLRGVVWAAGKRGFGLSLFGWICSLSRYYALGLSVLRRVAARRCWCRTGAFRFSVAFVSADGRPMARSRTGSMVGALAWALAVAVMGDPDPVNGDKQRLSRTFIGPEQRRARNCSAWS